MSYEGRRIVVTGGGGAGIRFKNGVQITLHPVLYCAKFGELIGRRLRERSGSRVGVTHGHNVQVRRQDEIKAGRRLEEGLKVRRSTE